MTPWTKSSNGSWTPAVRAFSTRLAALTSTNRSRGACGAESAGHLLLPPPPDAGPDAADPTSPPATAGGPPRRAEAPVCVPRHIEPNKNAATGGSGQNDQTARQVRY